MDLDRPELVVVADPSEGADQVPGLDGKAAASGEHQAGVLPGPAERFAVGGLLLLPGEQRRAGLAGDGKVTVARPGLDRARPQLSAHSPDLLADAEPASVQVHVLPAEAEDFTAAHSVKPLPDDPSMLRQWKRWESGEHTPSEFYQPIIAATFGTVTHAMFPESGRRDGNAEILAVSGMDTLELVSRMQAARAVFRCRRRQAVAVLTMGGVDRMASVA